MPITASSIRFQRPERVRIQDGWPTEDRDFTPWLAEHLDWMEIEELGALTLRSTEVRLPNTDRALDILAETSDGRQVAIENQYHRADHDHLTRGLAYAVGLEASALIVVAEAHAPEFVAVAGYLNRCAESIGVEQGIGVFLVVVQLERVGEYLVPRFDVISRPNVWLTASKRTAARPAGSLEDFMDQLQPGFRNLLANILDQWRLIPGATIVHKAAGSIQLNLANPGKTSGRTCVFAANSLGEIWFHRGYVLDGPAFAEDAAAALLDGEVHAALGGIKMGAKGYYGTVLDPEPASIAALGRWIADRFQTTQADAVGE